MDYLAHNIDIHISSMLLTTIVTVFLLLLTTLPSSLCQQAPVNYSVCSHKPYECGRLREIYYPFWGKDRPSYCGGGDQFNLTCEPATPGGEEYTSIQMGSLTYHVMTIDTNDYTMEMIPPLYSYDVCSPQFNISLSPLFGYPNSVDKITIFYNCSKENTPFPNNFTCPPGSGSDEDHQNGVYYKGVEDKVLKQYPELKKCGRRIQVPVSKTAPDPVGGVDALLKTLSSGFQVRYDVVSPACVGCLGRWGACETINMTTVHPFPCYYCTNGSNAPECSVSPHKSQKRWKVKLGIAVGAAGFGALAVSVAFYLWQRRKKTRDGISYIQPRSMSSDPSLKDTEIGRSMNYGVPVFSYSELEEATNHFDPSRELGDGGFGTVYFGKLRDGRSVAVKRLYENNYRRLEQFMNEIRILTSLHHKNLVSLYGCTSRHSRELLLVYEYIANGTVADHLHGDRAKAGALPWHIRMNIAVETASALTYLHASEVIHRDVKTNNILLDSHFVVKVADFGLSRLFPIDATHISTAPQGTPGYVDPEYHECYQLTVKSDVYSFGVVLVELISSLPAVDITRHRHEINLSTMAINKIHKKALHELVDPDLGFGSDYKVSKMINAVAELAFRCLQSSKDMRPSMAEVLDTLKDIQSDGKYKSQPEVMDISTADDAVLLKDDPPPPSPDSFALSKSTTPNASG